MPEPLRFVGGEAAFLTIGLAGGGAAPATAPAMPLASAEEEAADTNVDESWGNSQIFFHLGGLLEWELDEDGGVWCDAIGPAIVRTIGCEQLAIVEALEGVDDKAFCVTALVSAAQHRAVRERVASLVRATEQDGGAMIALDNDDRAICVAWDERGVRGAYWASGGWCDERRYRRVLGRLRARAVGEAKARKEATTREVRQLEEERARTVEVRRVACALRDEAARRGELRAVHEAIEQRLAAARVRLLASRIYRWRGGGSSTVCGGG
jgi:hypothetical protein